MKLVRVSDCGGVRLLNCSITEHSIAFDWQNFFVSSVKFDYQTQSSDWVRLPNVRLTTSGFRRLFAKCKHDCFYRAQSDFHLKILLFSFSCLLFDLFAPYTTWLAFFDLLPEPPFSFSLTFFYILPDATPFARFSGWKSLFCTRSALQ